jgi:hypothetical protein
MSVDITTAPTEISTEDRDYDSLRSRIQARVYSILAAGTPVFTTDASELFGIYLNNLPKQDRQHHDCHACKRFFETYGGLVTIDETGLTTPLIWDQEEVSPYYGDAIERVIHTVRRAQVTGVFYSSDRVWGQRWTGKWTHFAVTPPPSSVHHSPIESASQKRAGKLEAYKTVRLALGEYSTEILEQAVRLLESDLLYRGDKVLGPVKWLAELREAGLKTFLRTRSIGKSTNLTNPFGPYDTGSARKNLIWRAIATAPEGYLHPRSSMAGTLLDDLKAGLGFEQASARFAHKMHPLEYMRPKTAPAAQTIQRAEEIFETLGLAPALERRYARLEEIQTLWKPTPLPSPPAPRASSLFGHLTARDTPPPTPELVLPPAVMTWAKFAWSVWPRVNQMEFLCEQGLGYYGAILTAVHPDAPAILKWDVEGARNPASSYCYVRGSHPQKWGLLTDPGSVSAWIPVNAIVARPEAWKLPPGTQPHDVAILLVLDGAKDTGSPGLCLFPDIVRPELHAVRDVIHAHNQTSQPSGADAATVCGKWFGPNVAAMTIRAHTDKGSQVYLIDRWD